jgi:hypothetical protein
MARGSARQFVKRDNAVIVARKKGVTLEVIGQQHGITRERVRQILKARAGMTGWVRPPGFHTNLEKRAIRRRVRQRMPCRFPECQNRVGDSRRLKYCEVHTNWGAHHSRWKLWTPAQQARHTQAVVAWNASHPAARRRINARSKAKWRARLTSEAVHATLDKHADH